MAGVVRAVRSCRKRWVEWASSWEVVMTSTLRVLLLLSRAEGPDTSGRWRYLTTLAPLPRVGLGVEHAC